MNNYYIFISTDANRRFLQPGMTTDMAQIYQQLQVPSDQALFQHSQLNRVVYIECLNNALAAENRLQELQNLGRMVRERLVRKQNPNWLSLAPVQQHLTTNKKAVVYA